MKMTHFRIAIGLITFVLFIGAERCFAGFEQVCYGCHKQAEFSKRITHRPVASGQCSTCHNPHAAKHQGLLAVDQETLCYSCHTDEAKKFQQGVVHTPVRQGLCLACHDAHSSEEQGLLKDKLAKSCLNCHQSLAVEFKFPHQPYRQGKCDACHFPHTADNYQLLRTDPEKICQGCHGAAEVDRLHSNFPVRIEGCLTCHNPHGSDRKGIIRNVLHSPFADGCTDCHDRSRNTVHQDICIGCHEDVRDASLKVHNHLADKDGNSCVNCHSPHAGDTENLLRSRQTVVCRQCHNDTFTRQEASTYIHLKKVSDCTNCHAVHGSNRAAMLKGSGIEVCTSCHENQGKFTHPVGGKVTDPRNDLELTCVTCHDPHGTEFKGQLKLSGQEALCVQCHHM